MRETRALALLARIIGRKHGLEVEFSRHAQTAYTDGKKITLPVVSTLGTEEHAILIEGLLDHEAMHCRFTDFGVALGKMEPIVASLTNLIEDVWGEREQGKIYPGCARNIRRSMEVMIRLGWYRGPVDGVQESPPSAMTNFLVNGLLARLYQSPELEAFATKYRALLSGMVGERLVQRIWETACKVDRVQSTLQAASLAKEIVDLLRHALPPESPQASKGKGEASPSDGADSRGTQGQGQGNDQGQSQSSSHGGENGASPSDGKQKSQAGSSVAGPDQSGTSGGSQGQQNGSDRAGESRGNAIKQILDAKPDQLAASDMGDRLLAALNGQGKAGSSADDDRHASLVDRVSNPGASAGADVGYPSVEPKLADSDAFRFKAHHLAAIAMSRGIEVKLGTKLESLLEARTDSFVLHKRSGKRLEARRAARLSLGKLDVFRSVEEGDEVSTAVHFLIDCSASMLNNFAGTARRTDSTPVEESRIVAAAAVTYAAAQVLEKHDVPFAMACFGSRHLSLKTFDDRWPVARKRGLTESLGGTQTDLAVMRIANDLVCRDEARRLVVLVTDGESNDDELTRVVMNEVRKLGIEFAALFIGAQGQRLQNLLQADGYKVARAHSRESLASSFFEAVESAF